MKNVQGCVRAGLQSPVLGVILWKTYMLLLEKQRYMYICIVEASRTKNSFELTFVLFSGYQQCLSSNYW